MNINKQVLIITYYWPPSGGAGVQRWLKFARYLPDYSVRPHILTVDPDYAQYPATDFSLADEVNPDLKVYRTRARNYFRAYSSVKNSKPARKNNLKNKLARFIRGNFFIPDPRKGWNSYAFLKAEEILKKEKITSIITSGPPHSTHLIGRKIKRKYPDMNWVADFRDPWTDIYYYRDFYISGIARKRDRKLELSILKEADKIMTIGEGMKALLKNKIPESPDKISIIPNGYDEADFADLSFADKAPGMLISYVGSISDSYPLGPFLSAVKNVIKAKTDRGLRLQFVGKLSDASLELIKNHDLLNICEFIDYTSHPMAVKYICSADILLLLIPHSELNSLILTGKIYEYIRSGNRILGIGPSKGDAAELLEKTLSGKMIDPEKTEQIEGFILENLHAKVEKRDESLVRKYERKYLSSLLPDLL